MNATREPIHWTHLLLLAALPAWLSATNAWPQSVRAAAWLALAFAALAVAERWRPYRADWHPDRRALRRDGTVLALNVVVDAGATVLVGLAAALAFAGPSTLPLAVQVAIALGTGELLSWTLHRASHRGGWLWRVHLLHHRPEALNVANALTAHPVNALYDKLARVLPLPVLGLSEDAIVAATLFALTQSLVVHANVAGTIGWLEYVVGSAHLHRLHHSTAESQAVNFGTAVPWWDLAFGTYLRDGAPGRVGVFDATLYPHEHATAALLAWPFHASGDRTPPEGRRAPRNFVAADTTCGGLCRRLPPS